MRSESRPPLSAWQTTSPPRTLVTVNATLPSSTRMRAPGATFSARRGKDTCTPVSSPSQGAARKVNSSPSRARPRRRGICRLRRISGPLVSSIMAVCSPCFRRSSFTRSMRALWSACVPCEKLNRAQSMPESMSCSRTPAPSEAGPSVQMIFVFLIVLSHRLPRITLGMQSGGAGRTRVFRFRPLRTVSIATKL